MQTVSIFLKGSTCRNGWSCRGTNLSLVNVKYCHCLWRACGTIVKTLLALKLVWSLVWHCNLKLELETNSFGLKFYTLIIFIVIHTSLGYIRNSNRLSLVLSSEVFSFPNLHCRVSKIHSFPRTPGFGQSADRPWSKSPGLSRTGVNWSDTSINPSINQ